MGSTALQLGSSFMPQPPACFSVRLASLVSSWLLLRGSQSCLTSSKLQFLLSTFLPTLSSPAFPGGLWGQSPTPSTPLDTQYNPNLTHHTQRQGCTWSQIQSHKGPTTPRHRCRVSKSLHIHTEPSRGLPALYQMLLTAPLPSATGSPLGQGEERGASGRSGKGMECRGLGCSSALGS